MPPFREFELVEAGTRKRLGSITMDEATMPGVLMLRFRAGEIQLEVPGQRPAATPAPAAPDTRSSRPTSRKKPA